MSQSNQPGDLQPDNFDDVTAALGLAVTPVRPPADLKARLMEQLSSTSQLPALDPAPARKEADAAKEADATPAPAAEPAAVQAAVQGAGPETAAEKRARLRWFQRPATVLMAAAAALALFAGGIIAGGVLGAGSSEFEQQQASGLAQIEAAADVQRASTTTISGQTATLVWSAELGMSVMLVNELPALADGEDYQLWYVRGTEMVSAGTFDSAGTGTSWRVLDGALHSGDLVGITIEPDGGSPQPTSEPVVLLKS